MFENCCLSLIRARSSDDNPFVAAVAVAATKVFAAAVVRVSQAVVTDDGDGDDNMEAGCIGLSHAAAVADVSVTAAAAAAVSVTFDLNPCDHPYSLFNPSC